MEGPLFFRAKVNGRRPRESRSALAGLPRLRTRGAQGRRGSLTLSSYWKQLSLPRISTREQKERIELLQGTEPQPTARIDLLM